MSDSNVKSAVIAVGASLSNILDLDGLTLVGISMPSVWTSAGISFDVSNDGVSFGNLYYQGSEFVLTEASASCRISVDPIALLPWRYVKVRSGVNGAVIAQVAQATISLWTKPV